MVNVNEMTDETIKALAFSEDEKEALEKARKMPIIIEEDCPETTLERALRFRRVNPPRDGVGKRA